MGWEVLALVIGVPLVLMGLMLLLARFEDAAVQPSERAAAVVELLSSGRAPEDVERATAQMLDACTPRRGDRSASEQDAA
jgi:hypothetical protein